MNIHIQILLMMYNTLLFILINVMTCYCRCLGQQMEGAVKGKFMVTQTPSRGQATELMSFWE